MLLTRTIAVAVVLAAGLTGLGAAQGKDKATDGRAAWIGEWSAGAEQDIAISRDTNAMLKVEGFASWGASDPERVKIGAVNIGEFSVSVPEDWIGPDNDTMAFVARVDGTAAPYEQADQYDCALILRLKGDHLHVEDNMMCGGHNVTFNGVYQRAD